MWKVAWVVVMLPGLALAQSDGVSPSTKSANPLAGVTFWPKAQPFRNSSSIPLIPIRVSNVPKFAQPATPASKFADIRNRIRVNPATGRCAIPLVQLMAPTNRTFTLQRLVPTPMDESFATPPAVPSCAGE